MPTFFPSEKERHLLEKMFSLSGLSSAYTNTGKITRVQFKHEIEVVENRRNPNAFSLEMATRPGVPSLKEILSKQDSG
jgi:hypothetical protein